MMQKALALCWCIMHYRRMQTHPDIIRKAGTPDVVAAKLGVSVHTVRSWLQRERIPVDRWADFVTLTKVPLADIHAAAPPRKERPANQSTAA